MTRPIAEVNRCLCCRNGLSSMQIDAHQHFWQYSAESYPWISDSMGDLQRDFLPADLMAAQIDSHIAYSVAVQARQSLEENNFLLGLAQQNSKILGVVGWVDLQSPDCEQQLAEFAAHPKAVGVRHVVQDEPDDNFLLRPAFVAGLKHLPTYDLTYDLLIYPRQLPAAIELVRQLPEQPFVLDHLAKPLIRDQNFSPWRELIAELARSPNVCCKVSGMVTEAAWTNWQPADFTPYLDHVLEVFGPDRLMFGSDWPVCRVAAEYRQVVELVRQFIQTRHPSAEAAVFGETARQFYGLTLPEPVSA